MDKKADSQKPKFIFGEFIAKPWAKSALAAILIVAVIAGVFAVRSCFFHSGPAAEAGYVFVSTKTQKVAVSSKLRFEFPYEMDQKSAEESLFVPDGLTGTMSWDNQVLVFQPAEKLKLGVTHTFLLSRQAKRKSGSPLGRDITFKFIVAGDPRVNVKTPVADAAEVPPSTNITLVFDRPMVPLTLVQGENANRGKESWPVTIEPALEGRWHWLGTTTAEFETKNGLTPATTYKVNVPVGIASVNGDKTTEDFSWAFTTVRPQVTASQPEQDYELAGPGSEISLSFNLDMDLGTAREKISLYKSDQSPKENPGSIKQANIKSLNYGKQKNEAGAEEENPKEIVIEPENALEFNKYYMVKVDAGIKAARGDLGSEKDFLLYFRTVGDLSVTSASLSGSQIYIDFSNPIDEGSLKGQIKIQPAIADFEGTDFYISSWDKRHLSFYVKTAPSTKYQLTLGKAVKDSYGQTLKEDYVWPFETGPLAPQNFIKHQGGEFGIFEKDKPPVYYLNGVNVSKMNVDFARLSWPEFLSQYNTELENQKPLNSFAEYQAWDIPMRSELNKWEAHEFDLEKNLGRQLLPGIYAFYMSSPEYVDWEGKPVVQRQYFMLTNMALTLKYSGQQVLVWAVDMTNGQPIAGANIKLINKDNKVVATGQTDGQGFLEQKIDIKEFSEAGEGWGGYHIWVTAEKDGDFAFMNDEWSSGMEAWDFGLSSEFHYKDDPKYKADFYVYTDRPIYRAGDTAYFKGLVRLRDRDGAMMLPPKNYKMAVRVNDAENNEVYNQTLDINEFGSFYGELKLAEGASLGSYSIDAGITPDSDVGWYSGYGSFSVLAYRKPEYKVDVTPEKENYFGGEDIKMKVSGNYYFGAPMGEADVNWRANSTDYFFNKYTDDWYYFGQENYWCWFDCQREMGFIAEGSGQLDKSGNYNLSFPYGLDNKEISQVVTVEADVTDVNQRVVSNRASTVVHKAKIYTGIKTRDYVVAPGDQAKIDVIVLDYEGKPQKGQDVKVQMYERKWNTIRKKGVDGEYYYENEPEDIFIKETNVRTDKDGKATAEMSATTGGQLYLKATAKDKDGREASSGTSLYAWSDTYVNWPRSNNDRLDVKADKPEYKVGDSAKLLIKSPFQGEGVKALVTVERENVIKKEIVDIKSAAQPIDIQITEDLIPNAYVSVVLIKPRQGETFNENGLDLGVPAFRIGYVKLKVETQRKKLEVGIETDKSKYLPGEEVKVKLTAKDWEGKPAKAELSLGVVDMSVLALTGFNLPDLVDTFYWERGLGVKTAQMLIYMLERFKPGSKGGGGGLEDKKRGDFKDTAYWNPAIVTDDNGEANLSFNLPDNLTTWQLLAIAQDKGSRFGAATKEILETKKVIIRPVRPRFAVRGDEMVVSALIHNFLDKQQSFEVTLSGEGFSISGRSKQKVSVKEGDQQEVKFKIKVNDVDQIKFNFKAETEGARDEVEEAIPVYKFGTMQSVATSGYTEDLVTENVFVPSKDEADYGSLNITFAPTLAAYLPDGISYIYNYPYGCLEQKLSSYLPVVALKMLQGFDVFKFVEASELDKAVTSVLQEVYKSQRFDGGFCYWSECKESAPYLSAYVAYALQLTKKAGYSIDDKILNNAYQYLDGVLRNQKLKEKLDLTTRAYILFVLAEGGKGNVGLLNNLYGQKDELPLFAKAYLAMSYQQVGGNQKAQSLLDEILNFAKIDPRGMHFEDDASDTYRSLMISGDKETAIILQALVRISPQHDFIPRIVRYLLAVRQDGHWDSTQSTVATILAFTEFLKSTGELNADFKATLDMGGNRLFEQTFNKDNILTSQGSSMPLANLPQGKEISLDIQKEGTGRLYYDVMMDYFYTPDILFPVEEGIGITREMTPLDPNSPDLTVGSTQKIKLTITVPEDRHFVAVESPLPAGFEAIDTGLKTSQQLLLEQELGDNNNGERYWWDRWSYFTHTEFRDDNVFLFADFLPAGVYEYEYAVRVDIPGRFRYRPARVWEMYFPEVFGQTDGGWLETVSSR